MTNDSDTQPNIDLRALEEEKKNSEGPPPDELPSLDDFSDVSPPPSVVPPLFSPPTQEFTLEEVVTVAVEAHVAPMKDELIGMVEAVDESVADLRDRVGALEQVASVEVQPYDDAGLQKRVEVLEEVNLGLLGSTVDTVVRDLAALKDFMEDIQSGGDFAEALATYSVQSNGGTKKKEPFFLWRWMKLPFVFVWAHKLKFMFGFLVTVILLLLALMFPPCSGSPRTPAPPLQIIQPVPAPRRAPSVPPPSAPSKKKKAKPWWEKVK